MNSLHELLQLHKEEKVTVVASRVVEQELLRHPTGLPQHRAIYNLLTDIRFVPETSAGNLLLLGVGGGEDPLYTELKSLLPDAADALHIFQAIKNEVAYFVTADERTILRYKTELQNRFGVVAVLPSQLVSRLR